MGIISWIILGLIAGFIGSKIVDKRGHSIAAGPQKRLSGIKYALRGQLRSGLNNNVCLHATANVA